MNFYSVSGKCVGFISKKLKNIGFKNIESVQLHEDFVEIITKKVGSTRLIYKLQLTLYKEEINK